MLEGMVAPARSAPPSRRASDKVVAQIPKSAVSQVSNLQGASKFRPRADLEIGDTAGLEACATLR
jgi:hypothetical protein